MKTSMEKTLEFRYEQRSFMGNSLRSMSAPFKRVVNNGCTISSQDEELLNELKYNEMHNNGIIDWHLFKQGETILYATNNKVYGCSYINGPKTYVELLEIIDKEYLEKLGESEDATN